MSRETFISPSPGNPLCQMGYTHFLMIISGYSGNRGFREIPYPGSDSPTLTSCLDPCPEGNNSTNSPKHGWNDCTNVPGNDPFSVVNRTTGSTVANSRYWKADQVPKRVLGCGGGRSGSGGVWWRFLKGDRVLRWRIASAGWGSDRG